MVGACQAGAAPLRRVLDELDRHAAETPPAVDCLRAESFRAGGLLANPSVWTFAAPGAGRVPEAWLARGIAVSLELPWESERKARLWQVVWAGLFRAIETPHWQLPESVPGADLTEGILRAWLPAAAGPPAADVARLLRESWLNDDRLFAPVVPLRAAATRSQWRVDSTRLAVALALYELEAGARRRSWATSCRSISRNCRWTRTAASRSTIAFHRARTSSCSATCAPARESSGAPDPIAAIMAATCTAGSWMTRMPNGTAAASTW